MRRIAFVALLLAAACAGPEPVTQPTTCDQLPPDDAGYDDAADIGVPTPAGGWTCELFSLGNTASCSCSGGTTCRLPLTSCPSAPCCWVAPNAASPSCVCVDSIQACSPANLDGGGVVQVAKCPP